MWKSPRPIRKRSPDVQPRSLGAGSGKRETPCEWSPAAPLRQPQPKALAALWKPPRRIRKRSPDVQPRLPERARAKREIPCEWPGAAPPWQPRQQAAKSGNLSCDEIKVEIDLLLRSETKVTVHDPSVGRGACRAFRRRTKARLLTRAALDAAGRRPHKSAEQVAGESLARLVQAQQDLDYLAQRAKRGERQDFDAFLDKVPPPMPGDEL
jgi:hypothetical protein